MKFRCECGKVISDGSDYLPYKARVFADQDWFGVLDSLEQVMEEISAGKMSGEAARDAMIRTLLESSRLMYQCDQCGRVFVSDWQRNHHTYVPDSAETERQILRGKDESIWSA